MFFDIELELLEDHFDELERRIKDLERNTAYVGWFASQGQHYSGFTYVDLAILHHNGVRSQNIPARPLSTIAFASYSLSGSPLKQDLTTYLDNISGKPKVSAEEVMTHTAMAFGQHMQGLMGDPSYLKSNSPFTQAIKASMGLDPNSPLVMEGELRDNLSYKLNNSVAKPISL